MGEEIKDKEFLQEEHDRIRSETEAQMLRTRVNDYIAIALALGAVFFLWILQMMGLY